MSIPIYVAGAVVVGIFLYRFMYGTDTPHIKGLPEVPGLPVFGSLYELGTNHAKVAQGWAKKYGPVFQVRMGNKVRSPSIMSPERTMLTNLSELCSQTRSNLCATFGLQTNPP
jgi:phenylacetate 2-hydroxylase